jgi:molecular chaperone GrpE
VGQPDGPAGQASDDQLPVTPDGASGGPGEPGEDPAATIADLRARVAALEQEWRRALADADNLRKRYAREVERVRAQDRAEVARRFLPVVDDLDRALEHAAQAGSDPSGIVEGVRAVRDEALRVLADLGFPRRDDTGEPFDPARHEAVGSRPTADAPPGTVVQVLRPAYGSGENQLRPAMVVVAREP